MKFYHVYTNNSSPYQQIKGIQFIVKFYSKELAQECKDCLEEDYKNCLNKKTYMYTPADLPSDEYPKEDLKFWIEYK